MQWFGKPVNFNRFLGQVDQDDPTNLPVGLACVCRNTDFTRDSPGVTCAGTRAGINLAMQGIAKQPITGMAFFAYSPELPPQARFEMPLAFDLAGNLQRELPVGTGRMVQIPAGPIFTPPAGKHMIAAPADNKVWMAFSDLKTAAGGWACLDPNVVQTGVPTVPGGNALNPGGMKPVGWYWQPNTACIAGEYACPAAPATGNGHTYRCLGAGGAIAEVTVFHTQFGFVGPFFYVLQVKMQQKWTFPAGSEVAFAGLTGYPALNGLTEPTVAFQVGWNIGNYDPNSAYFLYGAAAYAMTADQGSALVAGAVGVTGANQPVWPLTEAVIFGDNTLVWQESTMVMANRLPVPGSPVVALAGGGALGPAQDIYIRIALANNQGATTASPAGIVVNVPGGSSVNVTIPALASMAGWVRSLAAAYAPTGAYVLAASVATGATAPALESYGQVGFLQALGIVVNVAAIPGPGTVYTTNTARITPGQLPTPTDAPAIERVPGGGLFAAGLDVYAAVTYTNSVGETKLGPTSTVINTVANDAIQATIAVPEDDDGNALYAIETVGLYAATVPTGTPAPDPSLFQLVGYYADASTPTFTDAPTGPNPPLSNTTGPGGAIVADTTDGGLNGGQGYRFAACLFMNQNETVSGFTIASVIQYDVDQDGWELAFFNIAIGPANIVARLVAPTVADGTQDGPFNWLGVIDLLVPTQNVVYPATTPSGTINETATALFDNVTTQAVFNFDDTFLANGNNVDDRTDVLPPFQPCRIDYLKTINALAFTGVAGYTGGALISISGDLESVYADQGAIPFPSDGQRCYGLSDAYKSVIFALREEGGFAIEPNSGNPATWTVVQRWSEVGPCGFRAWAATGKFIIFVHRSGVYRYDEADPDLMSKEIPRQWATVNWKYGHLISVWIDEDTHTVRIQVPTGESTVPNEEFCLSYLEGWQNPIHFSTFSGKEISMDAARRWSFNDVSAYVCQRMNRTLPPGPAFADGPDWTTQPDSSYGVSQLLWGCAAFDGTIQARTPGVYSDNGTGIDWQYETVSASFMQAVCKPEGFNLNCIGGGQINVAFLAARDQLNGPNAQQGAAGGVGIWMEPIVLDPAQKIGITRKCEPVIDEFWRVHFDNGKVPGTWVSLKQMNVYLIPFTGGRGSWEGNFASVLGPLLLGAIWGSWVYAVLQLLSRCR